MSRKKTVDNVKATQSRPSESKVITPPTMSRYIISFTATMGSGETISQKVNIEAPTFKRAVDMTSFVVEGCHHYDITIDKLS